MNSQVVPIPLRIGLSEGEDDKQLQPGTLTLIENGVWNKAGLVEKRYGTTALATGIVGGGVMPEPIHLLSRDPELLATDGDDLYSHSSAENAWKLVDAGIPAVDVTWRALVGQVADVSNVDIDATADYLAAVWISQREVGDELWVAVFDADTQAPLMPPTFVASEVEIDTVRVVILESFIVVAYRETTGGNVKVGTIEIGAFDGVATSTLRTDGSTGVRSLDLVKNGANFTIAYKNASNELKLYTYSDAFPPAQQASATVATSAAANYFVIDATVSESLYVKYVEPANETHRLAIHNPATLVQTVAPFTVHTNVAARTPGAFGSVARLDATHCVYVAYEFKATNINETTTTTYRVSNTGVVDAASLRATNWAAPISRPFVLGGRVYLALRTSRLLTTLAQVTNFIVEVETSLDNELGLTKPHRLIGTVAPREGAWAAGLSRAPVVDGEASLAMMLSMLPQFNSDANVPRSAILTTVSAERVNPWSNARVGDALAIAQGSLHVYDGRRIFDAGFIEGPHVLSSSSVSPGAGSMGAGTYQYLFVYEWRDLAGLLHRSIASNVSTIILGGGSGTATFEIQCASTSAKWDRGDGVTDDFVNPVYIVPYRTKAGGTKFYRMSKDGSQPANVIRNRPDQSTVTWTDTRADGDIDGAGTDLDTRPLFYTTGGVLDDAQPPSALAVVMHGGRLWLLAGDRRTLWYSKKWTADPGVFPGFHESLRVVLEEEVVAIESLDDKLVIFGREKIWIVAGEGPDLRGQGSTLSEPILVQSDGGCIDPRSLVSTPGGIMFQGRRGIYLLSRDLEVSWIGRAVQDQLASYPIITSAVLVAHRAQVRFTCTNAAGTSGRVLVWDYVNGNWSVFLVLGTTPIVSAVYHRGTWHWTGSTANLCAFKDDESTHLDGGSWVTLAFELAWFSAGGPIGWQRVRRVQLLGERVTHHDLTFALGFNHRATWAQSYTFQAVAVAVNNDCPTMRVGCQNGASPLCKALRVRVTDGTPTDPATYAVGSGKGGLFSAIGLEIVPQPGLSRHGARGAKV